MRFLRPLCACCLLCISPLPAQDGEMIEITPVLPKPLYVAPPVLSFDIPNLDEPNYDFVRSFKVPARCENVALGKKVISSDPLPMLGTLELVTDGDAKGTHGTYVELRPGKQWVQIDLGAELELWKIHLWHYHNQLRVYRGVRIEVGNDVEFKKPGQAIFNNDLEKDGRDPAYVERSSGRLIDAKGVKGRYVRLHSSGNTENEMNHYTEVAVYGRPPGPPAAR